MTGDAEAIPVPSKAWSEPAFHRLELSAGVHAAVRDYEMRKLLRVASLPRTRVRPPQSQRAKHFRSWFDWLTTNGSSNALPRYSMRYFAR
jgi:hypothetical protein